LELPIYMARALVVLVGFCLILGACTQKMVCPAYQSAFIYDKNELRKKYSYFENDTTPKVLTASKSKYLIAVPESYRKKMRNMATVEMKPVNPVVPDSLSDKPKEEPFESADEFSLAERDLSDSTLMAPDSTATSAAADSVAQDSVYVITKDREVRMLRYNFPDSLKYDPATGRYVREKPYYYVEHVGYNTEQDNYMWYLRDAIVLPDVRLAKLSAGKGEESPAGGQGRKKKGGFFKNLFKKKDKTKHAEVATDEQLVPEEEEEDLDFSDLDAPTDSTASDAPVTSQTEPVKPKKEKKGLFKKKSSKPVKKKDEATPTKKEEDDDGF
jgi:hypothetical protein